MLERWLLLHVPLFCCLRTCTSPSFLNNEASSEYEVDEQSLLDNNLEDSEYERKLLQIAFRHLFRKETQSKCHSQYTGSSKRNKWARNARMRVAAIGSSNILSYFLPEVA